MKTIEHIQVPDYFNKSQMQVLHGEGWMAMISYIGCHGLVGGIVGAILSVY